MSYLTWRAEHAFLGTLLAEPAARLHEFELETTDFGARAHRQVFTALAELTAPPPTLTGRDLFEAVLTRLDSPGAGREWLQTMRDTAPPAESLPAFAQTIKLTALRRDLSAAAERIAAQGTHPELSAVLARHATAFVPITAPEVPAGQLPALHQDPGPGSGNADPPIARSKLEDALLADLMRNPEQIPGLARTFTDGTFTSHQRAEIYRAILTTGVLGDPVDPVIVGVTIEQQRSLMRLHPEMDPSMSTHPAATDTSEPLAAHLERLTATPSPAPAAVIARDLLSAELREHLTRARSTAAPSHSRTSRSANSAPQPEQPGPRPFDVPGGPAQPQPPGQTPPRMQP